MPDKLILEPDALRVARRRAGLTQHELARRVGVGGGERVSKWEIGGVTPRLEVLTRVASVLGVAVEDLLRVSEGRVGFRLLRVRAGVTPAALAAAVNVSLRTLRRWEAGQLERLPGAVTVRRAAQVMGVSIQDVEAALRASRSSSRRGSGSDDTPARSTPN